MNKDTRLLSLTLTLSILFPLIVQGAQVYKCVQNGQVIFSQISCDDHQTEKIEVQGPGLVGDRQFTDRALRYDESKKSQQAKSSRQREQQDPHAWRDTYEGRMKIRNAIVGDELLIGMTADEVMDAWGPPNKTSQTVNTGGVRERWTYRYEVYKKTISKTVYFDDGYVTGWK